LGESKLLIEIPKGIFLLKSASNQEENWRSDNSYKFSKFHFAHYFKALIGVSRYLWLQISCDICDQEMLKIQIKRYQKEINSQY